MDNLEQRLAAAVAAIEQRDQELGRELKDKVRPKAAEDMRSEPEARRPRLSERLRAGGEAPATERRRLRTTETIVLRTGRPVLTVTNDSPELAFRDRDSEVWRDRLQKAKDQIHRAVVASGRIEVQHHPTFDWIGTGWLVRDDIIVTNRHVAKEFARKQGAGFRFRPGTLGRTMRASVDFLEELGRADERTFTLKEVLHIEGDSGPDMALLKVERNGALELAKPVALSPHAPIAGQQVATIGYPARDSRIPELNLMEEIFGDVFDKKRLAPGQVIRATRRDVQHDCSTLGGNSGSMVLDLESGAAVGLHFAGRFLEANFAVPAAVVEQRLSDLLNGERRSTVAVANVATPSPVVVTPATVSNERQVSLTIPIRITIDIGGATSQLASVSLSASGEAVSGEDSVLDDDDDDDDGEEDDDLT